ncbi:hypothetical protein GCM10010530_22010 [Kribbella aluminosa]
MVLNLVVRPEDRTTRVRPCPSRSLKRIGDFLLCYFAAPLRRLIFSKWIPIRAASAPVGIPIAIISRVPQLRIG